MAQHIVPQRIYYLIFATLLCLTLITIDVAFVQLRILTIYVALMIATGKALLVALYFMHLRYSSRLTWVFVGAGAFWLILLIGLTMSDMLTRSWLPVPPPWGSGPVP